MLLLASCKRGPEPFATKVTYEARKSGFDVIVYSKGRVQPYQDLTDDAPTVAVVCPRGKVGHPFRIDLPPWNRPPPHDVTVSLGAKTTSMSWEPAYREGTLTRALSEAGFGTPDAAELAELPDSIGSVSTGPKGTRIAGQTLALFVGPADFQAQAAPTIASCSP